MWWLWCFVYFKALHVLVFLFAHILILKQYIMWSCLQMKCEKGTERKITKPIQCNGNSLVCEAWKHKLYHMFTNALTNIYAQQDLLEVEHSWIMLIKLTIGIGFRNIVSHVFKYTFFHVSFWWQKKTYLVTFRHIDIIINTVKHHKLMQTN